MATKRTSFTSAARDYASTLNGEGSQPPASTANQNAKPVAEHIAVSQPDAILQLEPVEAAKQPVTGAGIDIKYRARRPKKDCHLQLLVTRDLHDAVKAKAKELGMSLNEYVAQTLRAVLGLPD